MHILVVTASLPYPLASGGAIRVFGMLHGLHQSGHRIALLSLSDQTEVPPALAEICESVEMIAPPQRSKVERLQTLLLSSQADIETRFHTHAFAERLIDWVATEQFDLVQFEAIESASYLPLLRAKFPQQKICFDTFNAEADLQHVIYQIERQQIGRWPQAIYSWLQTRRIHHYEGHLCRLADLVLAVSEEDQAILSRYRNDDRTAILPSGIFVDDYHQPETSITLPKPSVVFTGKMDYRPNVDAMLWFADHILPQVPVAHLTIVGQKPHPRIQHLPQRPNITLTGWVDTIPPYLHAADVYIAPLRMGSGTRLKILEAMASGCAIVATSIAAAGLSAEAKSAMIIVDDEQGFAAAIDTLLHDPAQRETLGHCAREQVRREYDWSVLIPRLLDAYAEANIG